MPPVACCASAVGYDDSRWRAASQLLTIFETRIEEDPERELPAYNLCFPLPMSARTEFTCPQCRVYDDFAEIHLSRHEGFSRLNGAVLFVCNNCGCAIIPEEEFGSGDIPDGPLAWPDQESAIDALLAIERRISSQPDAASDGPEGGDAQLDYLENLGRRLALAGPEKADCQLIQAPNYVALEYRNMALLSSLNGVLPTYYVHVYALARLLLADKEKPPYYMVTYTVVQARELSKSIDNAAEADKQEAFKHGQPLFWFAPHEEKIFLRLANPTPDFLGMGIRMASNYWSTAVSDDRMWKK